MERPYRMDKLSISIGRWDAKVWVLGQLKRDTYHENRTPAM